MYIYIDVISISLFNVSKTKVDVSISKVLDYKPGVMWSWWKNVDSPDDTLNKTEFKKPPLCSFKFNMSSNLVAGFPGEGPNNCYPKCCVVNTDREETMYFSKEEA